MGVHVLVLSAALTGLWVLPAVLTGRVARRYGHNPIAVVSASLIVGWPIALVAAAVMKGAGGSAPSPQPGARSERLASRQASRIG
jgi:hypothetical protein